MASCKVWLNILFVQSFITFLLSAPVPDAGGPPPPLGPGPSSDCEENDLPGHSWDGHQQRDPGPRPPCVRKIQEPPPPPPPPHPEDCQDNDLPGHEMPSRPLDPGPNRPPCKPRPS